MRARFLKPPNYCITLSPANLAPGKQYNKYTWFSSALLHSKTRRAISWRRGKNSQQTYRQQSCWELWTEQSRVRRVFESLLCQAWVSCQHCQDISQCQRAELIVMVYISNPESWKLVNKNLFWELLQIFSWEKTSSFNWGEKNNCIFRLLCFSQLWTFRLISWSNDQLNP